MDSYRQTQHETRFFLKSLKSTLGVIFRQPVHCTILHNPNLT